MRGEESGLGLDQGLRDVGLVAGRVEADRRWLP
jgi:hypothetical protein